MWTLSRGQKLVCLNLFGPLVNEKEDGIGDDIMDDKIVGLIVWVWRSRAVGVWGISLEGIFYAFVYLVFL